MSVSTTVHGLSRGTKWGLFAGVMMVWSALSSGSWLAGLAGVGVLAAIGWTQYAAHTKSNAELQPWPWPADLRAQAEAMARPIDPHSPRCWYSAEIQSRRGFALWCRATSHGAEHSRSPARPIPPSRSMR